MGPDLDLKLFVILKYINIFFIYLYELESLIRENLKQEFSSSFSRQTFSTQIRNLQTDWTRSRGLI